VTERGSYPSHTHRMMKHSLSLSRIWHHDCESLLLVKEKESNNITNLSVMQSLLFHERSKKILLYLRIHLYFYYKKNSLFKFNIKRK